MDGDGDTIPSSPSAETSPSSSDIATESTGSFFRDYRSTTFGTLMGVSLADEEQEQGQDNQEGRDAELDAGEGTDTPRAPAHEGEGWRWHRRWSRRRWRSSGGGWRRLCRDDDDGRVPTSLGHFLENERQLSGDGLLCGDGSGERDAVAPVLENDGRVRPSAAGVVGEESGSWKLRRSAQGASSSLARLPVLLTAICSGGAA
ncbi:hypothetical protein HU200_017488 [Digitaria exilis]|uniref:Uncharacterized protein n=1 Tax=Digitaria exilis TaxID=1010633 RepID=A0A835F5T0_9POAL|nr:hypothetical protein HU200_017488 [Digitaria exilis]CAB3450998.1 unnamed protein product [Digitaria exilis]